ncbi:1,3-beta-glucanosyltransferase gas1 [Tulasnella sp. 403]|nr:1,3-beta-glucanosyltransferase gas1 [Tulasnella sp. 403]
MKFSKAFAAVAALASTVSALPSVVRQGRYLYQQGGSRFFIKGIAYQEQGTVSTNDPTGFPEPTDYIDPLADGNACNRDLPYLKQLGVNTIRVYSVNSALNHDACMQAFSGAGIYVILDLALPVNGSIDRISPAWTTNLLDLYVGTVNAFLKYDNILAFNIGNEVVTAVADTQTGPFIKAAARDIKAYLKSKSSSALVGFSSTDGDAGWLALADYLACDSDATSIDLYGLNVYRWCGAGSVSNYATLITDYQNYPIPAYFSEFGCITSPPRLWTEVAALFGDQQMVTEWSGGVAFSYFPAVGGYGMVTISADGKTVTTSSDFTALQQQYSQVTFVTTPAQSAAGQNTQATCPAQSASWLASTTLPPTPVPGACQCLTQHAFSCVFSNTAANNTAGIIGDLLNYACAQIGTLSGSCTPIGGNGTTGVYGPFSICDPPTKLSYALSEYFELSNQAAGSCSFSGNASTVANPPANAAAASAAESSCASANPPVTTIPPNPTSTTPSTGGAGTGAATLPPGAGNPGGSSNNNGNNHQSGALSFTPGTVSVAFAAVVGVIGGVAILL